MHVLAIILVLGSRASRSAGCAGSAQAQRERTSVPVTSQASGRSFAVSGRDPSTKKIDGHRVLGLSSCPGFSRRELQWFKADLGRQIKLGQVAACRHIMDRGFGEQGALSSLHLEVPINETSKAPLAPSPGSQHQVISSERVKGGQPLYNSK
jgi:hypothetical protein